MNIQHVTVVGAGQMGSQIALNAAMHGYQVTACDSFPASLEKAQAWVEKYLAGRIAKGKVTGEEAEAAKARLTLCGDTEQACRNADLVIEAIVEKEEVKRELFAQLDKICRPDTLLTSNSSFIPSSRVASVVGHPERVANLHYFNPAMVMELVEVVQGPHTSDATIETLMEFARSVGKQPIWIHKEIDGFVANRLIRALNKEAWFLVNNGYVTPQEVDIAAEKGLNYPMGPFRLMDLIGLDVSYLSAERAYQESGDEKDAPPPLLKEKYEKGELGRKTGKGWYDYTK